MIKAGFDFDIYFAMHARCVQHGRNNITNEVILYLTLFILSLLSATVGREIFNLSVFRKMKVN
jgi:hypothetical protein